MSIANITLNQQDVGITLDVTTGLDVNLNVSVGPTGPVGPGVAAGGTTGQLLVKASNTDYDTAWGAAVASAVVNTPAGNLAATNVQSALNELDSEKVAKAGDTFTGTLAGTLAATTTDALTLAVTADTNPRLVVNADGTLEWGPGNATQDTDLFRSAADTLKTNDSFHVAAILGVSAAPSASAGITVSPTYTTFAGANKFGINASPTINMAAGEATFGIKGVQCQVQKSGVGNLTSSRGFVGLNLLADNSGAGNISEAIGAYFLVRNLNATSVFTAAYGALIDTPTTTGAMTAVNGLRVENQATASVTNATGISVKAQTGAGTSNVGVAIEAAATRTLHVSSNADNTTATAGIFFGSSADTNLYRSAANTLKTDDAFVIAGTSLTIGTNPASTGAVRLPNNQYIYARNAGNTADIALARLGTTDIALYGEGASSIRFATTTEFRSTSAALLYLLQVTNDQAAAAGVGAGITLRGTSGTNQMANIGSAWDGAANTDANLTFQVRSGGSPTTALTIASTLAATFAGSVTLADAKDLIVGSTTGTKIGTATSQKLSLWNATPDVQPTTAITGGTFVENSGTALNSGSTVDGYTFAQTVAALRRIGALA